MKLYENKTIIILSKHKKEDVIKPILEEKLGAHVFVENSFNTDVFGTFSREIPRKEAQINTARLKIKEALKLAKADAALVSEGSFGPHPDVYIAWNTEIVMLYDCENKIELYGIYSGPETNYSNINSGDYNEILQFAKRVAFPEHFLIMRPNDEKNDYIIKDINNYEKLESSFNECIKKSEKGLVFVETDMRAHANPMRMQNIKKATENLVDKLLVFCPKCNAFGFEIKETVYGLPCSKCALPSRFPKAYILKCWKCNFEEVRNNDEQKSIEPMYCEYCNP